MEVETELVEALFPENGLVLVTGVMGSGKSAFLAAALRRLAEQSRMPVAAYESPIEFDLQGLKRRISPLEQSEAPHHIQGFIFAARNLTRRAADAVLIGEARDPETIRGLMEADEIGVTAYATVHTTSVSDTLGRMMGVFDQPQRASLAAALVSAIRVIVQQRLYPAVGGGRRAVREYLAFNQDMRCELQKVPLERLSGAVEELAGNHGQKSGEGRRQGRESGTSASNGPLERLGREEEGVSMKASL